MPKYNYTGAAPRLLSGLIQGVNAHHFPADGAPSDLPDGSSVIVEHGDVVDTGDLLYPAFELADIATGSPSVTPDEAPEVEAPAAPAEVAPPAPVAPVADPQPAPVVTAPDAAPAPVEPAPAPAPTF